MNATQRARKPRAVFISYRRADSERWAVQLSRHIGHRFGHDLVFRDVEDIPPGTPWLRVIERELERSRVFLIVIGPHWVQGSDGRRRLDQAQDVLRREVTLALRSPGTVIPVLVGGAGMPAAAELPQPLRALTRLNALTMRPGRWAADVRTMLERLHELVLPEARRLPLERAHGEVQQLQLRYFEALESGAAARALELARQAHAYLDRAYPLYPQDRLLKVTRGYLFKNEAMALLALERDAEAATALDRGEQAFRTLLRERSRDAYARNGVGSVEAVRADLWRRRGRAETARRVARQALGHVERALQILPDYAEAQHDRRMLERFVKALG
jgi:hypothetical protein